MARKRPTLPPGGRYTAAGNISLQIKDPHSLDPTTLKPRRVKPRDVLSGEPASYATPEEAWKAYYRLTDAIKSKVERGVTVRDFWEAWTDESHWAWGARTDEQTRSGRAPQTLTTYRRRTRKFVQTFGDRPMLSIGVADCRLYMDKGNGKPSQVQALRTMFADAMHSKAGPLRTDNPWQEIAEDVAKAERDRREWKPIRYIEPAQIEALLLRAREIDFSIYAWLLVANRTGMRCGEVDAMRIEHLRFNGDECPTYYVAEQFNHATQTFTEPKWRSYRTIVIPAELIPTLRECIVRANRVGSPFLFTTPLTCEHFTASSRNHYWNDYGQRTGLRHLVGGASMKEATRTFFATQMALRNAPVIAVAKHLGHKDNGQTLAKFYMKVRDVDTHETMAAMFDQASVTRIRRAS